MIALPLARIQRRLARALGPLLRPLNNRPLAARDAADEETVARAVLLSGFFDPTWYLDRYPEVRAAGLAPLSHYVRYGATEGRWPGPRFNAPWYRAQHPELLASNENPVLHYLRGGAEAGPPAPPFDDDAAVAQEVLSSGYFDLAWYLRTYPEAARADLSPLRHFLWRGGPQGFSPGPHFDAAWYLAQEPGLAAAGVNPLVHYLKHGREEGRHPAPPPGLLAAASAALAGFNDLDVDLYARLRPDDLAGLVITDGLTRRPWYPPFRALMRSLDRSYRNVVLVPWMTHGGADLVAAHLARLLVERDGTGSTLFVLTDSNRREAEAWLPDGIDRRVVSDLGPDLDPGGRAAIVEALVRGLVPERVFNVNSRAGWDAFVQRGRPLATASRLFGFAFCRDYTPAGRPAGYADTHLRDGLPALERVFLDNARFRVELVAALSLPERQGRKLTVVPQPVALDAFPPRAARPGSSDAPFTVLWASRFARQKNVNLLARIIARAPEIRFEIWGRGDEAATTALRERLAGCGNAVLRGGFDAFPGLPLGECDAFLYTSLWDGLPNVLLEAAASSLPIVAPDVGGISELVYGETGWLVPAEAGADAYVAALRAVRAEPEKAARRGAAVRALVRRCHGWDAYRAAMDAALDVPASGRGRSWAA